MPFTAGFERSMSAIEGLFRVSDKISNVLTRQAEAQLKATRAQMEYNDAIEKSTYFSKEAGDAYEKMVEAQNEAAKANQRQIVDLIQMGVHTTSTALSFIGAAKNLGLLTIARWTDVAATNAQIMAHSTLRSALFGGFIGAAIGFGAGAAIVASMPRPTEAPVEVNFNGPVIVRSREGESPEQMAMDMAERVRMKVHSVGT